MDPAPMQSHTITASGAAEKSTYLYSLNFLDQKGTLLNTYLKRYTARVNTSWNIKNNIRIGENMTVFYRDNPRIGNNQEGNDINNTAWEQPIIPVLDAGGGFGGKAGSQLGKVSKDLGCKKHIGVWGMEHSSEKENARMLLPKDTDIGEWFFDGLIASARY